MNKLVPCSSFIVPRSSLLYQGRGRMITTVKGLLFALFFAAVTYTGIGCGGSSAPPPPVPVVDAELTGTVRDAVNGAPLYPASVTLSQNGQAHATATNAGGLYFIGNLAPGRAHVIAEAPGH